MDAEWIYGKKRQDERLIRELKVKLPATYHDKLQKLKVLRGKTMSRAVAEALDVYLAQYNLDPVVTVAAAAQG